MVQDTVNFDFILDTVDTTEHTTDLISEIQNNVEILDAVEQASVITDDILDLAVDINPATEALMTKMVSNYRKQLGFYNYNLASESFKNISLENSVIDTVKRVWDKIVGLFKAAIKWIKQFIFKLFDKSHILERQIDYLISKSSKKDSIFKPKTILMSLYDLKTLAVKKDNDSRYLINSSLTISTSSFLNSMQNGFSTLLGLINVSYETLRKLENEYRKNSEGIHTGNSSNNKYLSLPKLENLSEDNFKKITDYIKRNFKKERKTIETNLSSYVIEFGNSLYYLNLFIYEKERKIDIQLKFNQDTFFSVDVGIMDKYNMFQLESFKNSDCNSALKYTKTILVKMRDSKDFLKDIEEVERKLDTLSSWNGHISENIQILHEVRNNQKEMVEMSKYIIKICSEIVPKASSHVLRYVEAVVRASKRSIG